MRAKRLTVAERKEIFHALVTAQDSGLLSVAESIRQVAQHFDITEAMLRQIEQEGIDREWPPLDEAVQPLSQE